MGATYGRVGWLLVLNLFCHVNTYIGFINRFFRTIRRQLRVFATEGDFVVARNYSVEAVNCVASDNCDLRLNHSFMGTNSTYVTVSALTDVFRRRA